jgi:hypothetical protein
MAVSRLQVMSARGGSRPRSDPRDNETTISVLISLHIPELVRFVKMPIVNRSHGVGFVPPTANCAAKLSARASRLIGMVNLVGGGRGMRSMACTGNGVNPRGAAGGHGAKPFSLLGAKFAGIP